jgi:NADPH:quinone reductase-like Zn-dependent oxidoreductase
MKAVTYFRYGGPEVLEISELPKPELKGGQILVRVRATAVTSGDARVRAFNIPGPFVIPARFVMGWPAPKDPRLGLEFAGEVEALGPGVTRFAVGDRVYGNLSGANAEYIAIADTGPVAKIPAEMTFADAAALPFGVSTALHFLKQGKLAAGQSIMIIGASGCVGAYAVQLAKHMGATVTAVCSGRNAEMVRALGADRVIDYAATDYLKSGPYDVVMDAVGAIDFNKAKPVIKRGGVFLNIVMGGSDLLAVLNPFKGGRLIVTGSFEVTQATLLTINDLVEADAIAPVIDRSYSLEQIRDAHAYVDTKRKRGVVVVTV